MPSKALTHKMNVGCLTLSVGFYTTHNYNYYTVACMGGKHFITIIFMNLIICDHKVPGSKTTCICFLKFVWFPVIGSVVPVQKQHTFVIPVRKQPYFLRHNGSGSKTTYFRRFRFENNIGENASGERYSLPVC